MRILKKYIKDVICSQGGGYMEKYVEFKKRISFDDILKDNLIL